MYKKLLKIFSITLILIGTISSLTIFAFKIFLFEDNETNLVILGPDNLPIYSVPIDQSGFNVKNLDIDILNNKISLNNDEKLRPLSVKPELLPIETIENNITKKPEIKNEVKKNITKIKKKVGKKKSYLNIGMYRVQFGSFRDLDKAKVAIKSMKKKFDNLLKEIDLKIFSYTNNDDLIYHRVWTSSLKKTKAISLCNQFKIKKMVCILKVVR